MLSQTSSKSGAASAASAIRSVVEGSNQVADAGSDDEFKAGVERMGAVLLAASQSGNAEYSSGFFHALAEYLVIESAMGQVNFDGWQPSRRWHSLND